MIRFIHAADLHLDTPFSGLEQTSRTLAEKLRKAPYESLTKIIDVAIKEAVDFVLLAGDLYNTKRINIRAQSLFVEQLKRLEEAGIAVFLIRGNHDYLTEETKNLALPLPKNVYTFTNEVKTHLFKTKNKERIAVSGFSYDSQWVFERKIKEFPLRAENVNMHIGLYHGDIESNHERQANYAPFTIQELRQKNYDYWALGHIHQLRRLSSHPLTYYSGNIQGLHKNEIGKKGCLLVEWTPHEQEVQFIETAPIVWEQLEVHLQAIENIPALIQELKNKIQEKNYQTDTLVHLTIRASTDEDENLVHYIQQNDFLPQLTKQLGFPNVWLASMDFILDEVSDQKALEKLYPKEWEQALTKMKEPAAFQEVTEQVLEQIPSKYLNEVNSDTYRKEMIEKAIAKIHLK